MTPATEMLLDGRYKLTSHLASGGMGEVWAATDEVLGRSVAVKILRREYAEDPNFRERFRAEARHTAALSHVGIAAIFDYSDGTPTGKDRDAHAPYLVMELIDGEPLSAVIAREGAMRPQRALEIIGQVAGALQTAHDNGVIHRDVKPGNILLTATGAVKITDFGISRATNSVPLTQTGTIMGTANYISPEQASGQSVTPASDIYSLGVVAYECLSGRRPFAGDTPVSVAVAQVREQPPALGPDVSPAVGDLVMRMLAKDPRRRPGSAGQVATEAMALMGSAAAPTAQLRATSDPDEAAHGLPTLRGRGNDTDPGFRLPTPRSTPRWVPAAAALSVLALLLLVVRGCATEAPTTTSATTSATTGPSASTKDTPAAEAVLVRASEYRGQSVSRARADLRALGLQVVLRPVRADPSTSVGTVSAVDPTGRLSPGTAVTLEYARAGPGNRKPPKDGKRDKPKTGVNNGPDQEEDDE